MSTWLKPVVYVCVNCVCPIYATRLNTSQRCSSTEQSAREREVLSALSSTKVLLLYYRTTYSLGVCSRYVSILVELTRMEGTRHGKMIASQMLDVAVRVQAIRHFAVAQMVRELVLL